MNSSRCPGICHAFVCYQRWRDNTAKQKSRCRVLCRNGWRGVGQYNSIGSVSYRRTRGMMPQSPGDARGDDPMVKVFPLDVCPKANTVPAFAICPLNGLLKLRAPSPFTGHAHYCLIIILVTEACVRSALPMRTGALHY